MKTIKIGESLASAVSLGCMRMSGLDEKSVDAIMDTAIANGMKKVKEYPDEKNKISYAYAIKREEWSLLNR